MMFVNYKKDKKARRLGSDVFWEKKKKEKVIYTILGVLAFGLLNLILYYLTKV